MASIALRRGGSFSSSYDSDSEEPRRLTPVYNNNKNNSGGNNGNGGTTEDLGYGVGYGGQANNSNSDLGYTPDLGYGGAGGGATGAGAPDLGYGMAGGMGAGLYGSLNKNHGPALTSFEYQPQIPDRRHSFVKGSSQASGFNDADDMSLVADCDQDSTRSTNTNRPGRRASLSAAIHLTQNSKAPKRHSVSSQKRGRRNSLFGNNKESDSKLLQPMTDESFNSQNADGMIPPPPLPEKSRKGSRRASMAGLIGQKEKAKAVEPELTPQFFQKKSKKSSKSKSPTRSTNRRRGNSYDKTDPGTGKSSMRPKEKIRRPKAGGGSRRASMSAAMPGILKRTTSKGSAASGSNGREAPSGGEFSGHSSSYSVSSEDDDDDEFFLRNRVAPPRSSSYGAVRSKQQAAAEMAADLGYGEEDLGYDPQLPPPPPPSKKSTKKFMVSRRGSTGTFSSGFTSKASAQKSLKESMQWKQHISPRIDPASVALQQSAPPPPPPPQQPRSPSPERKSSNTNTPSGTPVGTPVQGRPMAHPVSSSIAQPLPALGGGMDNSKQSLSSLEYGRTHVDDTTAGETPVLSNRTTRGGDHLNASVLAQNSYAGLLDDSSRDSHEVAGNKTIGVAPRRTSKLNQLKAPVSGRNSLLAHRGSMFKVQDPYGGGADDDDEEEEDLFGDKKKEEKTVASNARAPEDKPIKTLVDVDDVRPSTAIYHKSNNTTMLATTAAPKDEPVPELASMGVTTTWQRVGGGRETKQKAKKENPVVANDKAEAEAPQEKIETTDPAATATTTQVEDKLEEIGATGDWSGGVEAAAGLDSKKVPNMSMHTRKPAGSIGKNSVLDRYPDSEIDYAEMGYGPGSGKNDNVLHNYENDSNSDDEFNGGGYGPSHLYDEDYSSFGWREDQKKRKPDSIEFVDMQQLMSKAKNTKGLYLPTFIPAHGCTNASDFIVRCFVARLRAGLTVTKHSRSRFVKSHNRILHILPTGYHITWIPETEEEVAAKSAKKPPTKLDLTKCLEVRHAWSRDPKSSKYTGTATLRSKCQEGTANRSFALIYPQRTVDFTAASVDQCKILMEGFSALCFRLQMARLEQQAHDDDTQYTGYSGIEHDADSTTVSLTTGTNMSAPWGL